MKTKRYWGKAIISFLVVLFTMPLGHALMILMEHCLPPVGIHYAAFAMGFVGLVMAIIGVFAKGDTRQTLWGLFGGLLFWTGWVEFIYVYYATRFGVKPLLDAAGNIVTRPEYLIMPSSFGFWVMFMMLYIFSAKTGCDFIEWLQKVFFRNNQVRVTLHPMTRHTSIVTFMELNAVLWTCYLLLLFCYDDNFLGDHHPVTVAVAIGSLIASFFMFKRMLKISTWGYSIRFAIATVIVFWNAVEIIGRWDWFTEIWIHPLQYVSEMVTILVVFVIFAGILIYNANRKKKNGDATKREPQDGTQ
jgi:hypothetical protein